MALLTYHLTKKKEDKDREVFYAPRALHNGYLEQINSLLKRNATTTSHVPFLKKTSYTCTTYSLQRRPHPEEGEHNEEQCGVRVCACRRKCTDTDV